MFGNYFYHERIKKAVSTFGKMFNDIYILRKSSSTQGATQMKVPLSYGPRAKFLERIRQVADLASNDKVAIKLPRLSFEIEGISYDVMRQLPKLNDQNRSGSTNSVRNKFRSGVPYIMNFALTIYAKNQDDALQIVEQIIPYFAPQYTLTIKPFNEFDSITEDVPIILTGVNFNDDYEGEQGTRRTIQYTLTFDMHIYFHGKIDESSIIREVNANTLIMNSGLTGDSDVPLERINLVPNPLSVSPDSDFGFTETFILAADSDAGVI
jgi:hypothetical protein